jgi:hypothetical protein
MAYLKNLGHEVEIINYKPKYLEIDYIPFAIHSPKWKRNIFLKIIYLLLKMPEKLGELPIKHAFDAFRSRHLAVTAKRYASNEELRRDPPKAEAYICGSDQIWNCNRPSGHDPAFYLDFAPAAAIKMSYAASFAMDYIPENLKDELRQRIDKLDHISVRESDAISLLRDIGINRGLHVLDPVFLLDKSDWEKMAKPVAKGKYILIFNFDNDKIIFDAARKVAAIRHCPMYAANMTPLKGVDKNYRYASPDEFLGLIKEAEYVVTNSFHAIAFALIFNVEFFALGRTEQMNSRIISLLRSLELEKRYLIDAEFDASQLPSINYQEVEKRIDKLKLHSKQFLENALRKKVNN